MNRRRWLATITTAAAVSATLAATGPQTAAAPETAVAKADRSPMGNGLGRLVKAETAPSIAAAEGASLIRPEATTIRDAAGRVLIDLTPQVGQDQAAFRAQAERAGLVVSAVDADHGTLEGYAPISAITSLASLRGTGTIAQAVRPASQSGSVPDQGVRFQNVNQALARGINGSGITIGALSDSYDTATTDVFGAPLQIHAKQDVASGDLPGPGNSVNSKRVRVLEDIPASAGGFDEGRAMLQIAHDVAPKSTLCFATAFSGEVGFANNIRALADDPGPCGADVVVDDVKYFSEPFFSDGIIADAVDDVTAQGVQYFSSAGNAGERQGWRAPVDLVPAASSLAGTNLDFSNVDPGLYDGGLQDFDRGPSVDPAQNYALGAAGGLFDLQWDDPLDLAGATLGDPIFRRSGEITVANPAPSFTFPVSAAQVGSTVQFRTDGIPSGTTDLILTINAPDGSLVGQIDTGASPEVLVTKLNQAGGYTITITGFQGAVGDFTVDVSPVLSTSKVTTDFNALFFTPSGQFLGALSDVNTLSGRPSELGSLGGFSKIQVVISRSGTGPMGATTLAQISNGDLFVDEYLNPRDPATFGHSVAAGAVGVAAYDTFRPFLPESFTSPGGALPIRFDSSGDPYPSVQTRLSPLVASTDGANTTFFVSDTARDPDNKPNFFGTSAAAPHAAAIAALALDANGGPRSLSPARMKALLSRSTFAHDLDPFVSKGRKGGLKVVARSDQGDERSPYRGGNARSNVFDISYAGSVPLKSLTFFGGTASPTALGVSGGESSGIVFDPRPYSGPPSVRTQGYPFTVGGTSGGLNSASVSAAFSGAGGPESEDGQYRTMTVQFSAGMSSGQSLLFGVDRDLAISGLGAATEGNSADDLGGAVDIPSGVVLRDGMQFRAVRADGSVIEGVMRNKLGQGFSVVDGYGVIDAAQAVLGQ